MKNLIVLGGVLFASTVVTVARGDLAMEATLQRHAAFDKIREGRPFDAATDLVEQMAAYPTSDPYAADAAGGNMHLLLFTIGWVLTEDDLNVFRTQVLKPEDVELHRLIDAIYLLVNPLEEEDYYAYLNVLDELTGSDNHFIAVVALYASADPYITRDKYLGTASRERLAVEYPGLRATTSALRQPIFWMRNAPGRAAMLAQTGRRGEYWFPESVQTMERLRNDSFRNNAMELLPPLSGQNGDNYVEAIKQLGKTMNSAEDWLDRYAYLRMLEPHVAPKQSSRHNRDAAVAAVENLAQRAFDESGNVVAITPDVTRAWSILAKDARRDCDFERAKRFVELLLNHQKRPVEAFERSLFEETMLDYRHYAQRLKEMKRYAEAADAFTRLANFYPNSALQIEFLAEAAICLDEAPR